MLIGFLGDLHGRVFLALAVLVTWQRRAGRRFDLIVQVGDLGAFPRPVASDANPHVATDPAENDFSRLLAADGALADRLRRVRAELGRAVHFLRGNHEDFDYLRSLAVDPATGTAGADPSICTVTSRTAPSCVAVTCASRPWAGRRSAAEVLRRFGSRERQHHPLGNQITREGEPVLVATGHG
jgi:hypothetical protein